MSKDEGAGVMISAFVSRWVVYGTVMSEDEFNKVNAYQHKKSY